MSNKKGALATAILAALLGAASGAAAAPLTGPLKLDEGRPDWGPRHPALCSASLELCVHAPPGTSAQSLSDWLQELQRVTIAARDLLHWPCPRRDDGLGGNDGFDVYLKSAGTASAVGDAPTDLDWYDRTSAWGRADPKLPAGCMRSFALARAYARAGLYNVDAGAHHALAESAASYVASVIAPCEPLLLPAMDDYQANPQRAVSTDALSTGAMLLPWFVQTEYGIPQTVDLLHALWIWSQQRTPAGSDRYVNQPDFVDVLRSFQKDRGRNLGDLLLEYAVARAFVGDRDDGLHMPDSRWLGSAGRVRFEARTSYAALPQWVRPLEPVEPTGATYVWIDVKGAPAGAGLGMRVEWELPAVFRFAVLKIDAKGSESGRLAPMTQEKASSIDINVEDVSGADAILIVGANAGATSGEFKFDPDEMPYEPQGYLMTIVAQR